MTQKTRAPGLTGRAAADISRIYKEYSARPRNFILRRIPVREEGEDILQEVFYSLSKVDLAENPIEQMSAWLYSVARNRITDHSRKRREQSMPQLRYMADGEEAATDISYLLQASKETPEDDLLKAVMWEELEEALKELPPEQRSVFELTELEGFSFKEISEATGLSVNTLISRKRYAVLHLREKLREVYEEMVQQ